MKKLLLLLTCAFAFTAGMNAQDPISLFGMNYFDTSEQIDYETSAGEPDTDGEFSYYIDMYSTEDRAVSLIVTSKNASKFISLLTQFKTKFINWDSTAVANNITDLNKTIKTEKLKLKSAFLYGDWQFDYSVNLEATFKHINAKPVLIVRTGELQSSSNQFMKTDSGIWVFNSAEEIQTLIDTIDSVAVKNHFDKKNSKKDLFED
jgi:D-ribose pyranose/furanose isomerase RbsD